MRGRDHARHGRLRERDQCYQHLHGRRRGCLADPPRGPLPAGGHPGNRPGPREGTGHPLRGPAREPRRVPRRRRGLHHGHHGRADPRHQYRRPGDRHGPPGGRHQAPAGGLQSPARQAGMGHGDPAIHRELVTTTTTSSSFCCALYIQTTKHTGTDWYTHDTNQLLLRWTGHARRLRLFIVSNTRNRTKGRQTTQEETGS
mmetsp:Transcript_31440/g.65969  ORF Transcript_31440/g.65969 Transcript_31440/m.65969 type:complete len:200 (+) Transcript_31440:1561-2160(+)